jgi:hypothetical protein
LRRRRIRRRRRRRTRRTEIWRIGIEKFYLECF